MLRLPWEVAPIFRCWLDEHFPDRAERVMARVRELHGGRDYDARPGARMTGSGVWVDLIAQRFDKARTRLGYERVPMPVDVSQFCPPRRVGDDRQAALF